jgi:hypothetical protein
MVTVPSSLISIWVLGNQVRMFTKADSASTKADTVEAS